MVNPSPKSVKIHLVHWLGLTKLKQFSTQNRELVSILVDLENADNKSEANTIAKNRLSGYFCSDTVFNLSSEVFTDSEIKVHEKDFDYALIHSKINESEPRNDFEEFCRRMYF